MEEDFCGTASDGKVEAMKELLRSNPTLDVNWLTDPIKLSEKESVLFFVFFWWILVSLTSLFSVDLGSFHFSYSRTSSGISNRGEG